MAILGGCDVTIRDGDIKNVSIRHRASREWNRHYPLTAGGRVEIVNNNGPIEVSVGPDGEVDVTAALEAQAMTEAAANEILSEVTIEESAKPDHVRVATATARRSRRGGFHVSYKVTVPADARLEMNGTNSRLRANGLRGHVKAMVENGGIDLTAMRGTIEAEAVNASITAKMADVVGPIRLESTNGRVSLELLKSAKATLNVRSINGRINVTGLSTEEGTGRNVRTLESQLNGGGPQIHIRATNGRVNVAGVDSLTDLSPESHKSLESQKSRPSPPTPPSPPSPPKP
jgi:hypothetical protein